MSETQNEAEQEFCEEICEKERKKGEHPKKCVRIGKVKKRHWEGKNFKWVAEINQSIKR